MRKSFLAFLMIFAAVGLTPALAQQSVFNLRIVQGSNVFQAASGQTLNFTSTAVGQAAVLTLTGTYTGPTTAVISAAPQVLGSPEFTISSIGTLPLTLKPGDTFKLDITFTPMNTASAVAQLTVNFTQSAATAGQPGSAGSITLNLSGVVPSFSVNYLLPPNNNVTPISDGGTIAFPATLVNTSVTGTILVANMGTGPSTINSISITGAAFQLQGIGLLPAGLQSGGSLSFAVKYSPVKPGADTGTLTLGFPNQTVTLNLTGTATSTVISYQTISGNTVTPLTAGQQINVPDSPIGVLSSIAVQVQNTGTAPAVVNTVSSSGAGFTLTDLPFLPITLLPGDSFTFTVNFTPPQAGPATGTLTIGADRFKLAGNGLGAQLMYSYVSSASGNPVTVQPPAGTVLFSSVPLAQTSTALFTITNTGTTSTTLTSLGFVGTNAAAFSIVNSRPLPATIPPQGSYSFTISFTPVVQGLNTANLLVNGQSFVLSAFGSGVPQLQSFQFTGASGQVQPFTQPAIGLTLAQPYPLALGGTIAVSAISNVFSNPDPAVQFATGGNSVPFSIPAGSTQAVFSNGSTQIPLQTGTVAENINVTATFTTTGGAVVSPVIASPLNLTVARSAPQLIGASLQNVSATGFNVTVTGFSTSRNLSKVNLQFSGAPGLLLSGATFAVDVSESAQFWFSSAASQQFGGFFSITIPFTVKVTSGTAPTSLAGDFTVAATAVNDVGTSNSVTGQ